MQWTFSTASAVPRKGKACHSIPARTLGMIFAVYL